MRPDTPWTAHSGNTNRKGFPYWVGRTRDNKTEYFPNASGGVRGFKTMGAAQKVADRLQVTADFNDSREHMRLAVHHMIRATDGLQPTHPLLKVMGRMSDMGAPSVRT